MEALRKYLSQTGTTQAGFARAVGVTQATVSKLCAGSRPSLELAFRIERATEGAVPVASWTAPAGETSEDAA